MLLPNVMSAVLKRADFSITIISWLVGNVFLIVSIYVGNCYNSVTFFVFGSFYMLLSSRESDRCRTEIETNAKLQIELLAQKVELERQESEKCDKELRHMIANVAHDLKTVSSDCLTLYPFSFM